MGRGRPATLFTAVALLSGEAEFLHRNTDVVRLRNAVTREMADWRECKVLEFQWSCSMQVKVHAYFGWVVCVFRREIPSLVERPTTEPSHTPCYCNWLTTLHVLGQVRPCMGLTALYNFTSNDQKLRVSGSARTRLFVPCTEQVRHPKVQGVRLVWTLCIILCYSTQLCLWDRHGL